jgi:large subunit ribosomal protein L20
MGRATSGSATHRRKHRLMKKARGYQGAKGRTYRLAKEALVRAGVNAYRDRKRRKREYRALWITRLTAACRAREISYSRFIFGLQAAGVELDRKSLSEIAIASPGDFDALVEIARKNQPKAAAA